MTTPASASIFSRSVLQFFCWRRYSFLSSSLLEASCFCSRERIWRSRVRMVSTVLLTLSSRRLRSMAVYLSSRTMREMSTFSRAISHWVRRAAEALALEAGAGPASFSSRLGDFFLMLDQRFDADDGGLDARHHDILGELLVVEDHHLFDVAHAALEILAERGNLADHDGRAGDGFEHAHLAALDALGDLDLALAGEQRHGAHLAQIHTDRVVGFFQGSGRQIQLDVLALFQFKVLVAEFGTVQQVDALGVDGGNQVVQVFGRRAHLVRQHVVDVAVGEIALFLAHFNQGVDVVVLFVLVFKFVVYRQNIPTLIKMKMGRREAPSIFSSGRCFERTVEKTSLGKSKNRRRRTQRRVLPQKAVSGWLLERGVQRIRFGLGRPRAGAHGWG